MTAEHNPSPGHGKREVDHILITLLAGGMTQPQAAKVAGVSVETVQRRMKSPKFLAKLQEQRTRTVEMVTGKIVETMASAVDRLKELMASQNEQVALGAARSLLGLGREMWEVVDQQRLVEEVTELLERAKSEA